MFAILSIVAAYVVADALSAIYHLLTDKGWNIPSQLRFFRQHHVHPETMTFDLQPLIAGVPIFLAGLYLQSWFVASLGVFLSLAQTPHYYAHFPAPAFVRGLANLGLIITPEQHASHHSGQFDKDYCVLNGWNNWWVNRLAKLIPERDRRAKKIRIREYAWSERVGLARQVWLDPEPVIDVSGFLNLLQRAMHCENREAAREKLNELVVKGKILFEFRAFSYPDGSVEISQTASRDLIRAFSSEHDSSPTTA